MDGQRRHLSSSSSSSLIVDGPRRYLLSSSSSSIVDGPCWYFLSLSLSTVGAATSSPLVIVGHGWAVPHPFVGCGWSVLPPPLHHRSWRVGAPPPSLLSVVDARCRHVPPRWMSSFTYPTSLRKGRGARGCSVASVVGSRRWTDKIRSSSPSTSSCSNYKYKISVVSIRE